MRLFKRRLKNALSSMTATLKTTKRKIVRNCWFPNNFPDIFNLGGLYFEINHFVG